MRANLFPDICNYDLTVEGILINVTKMFWPWHWCLASDADMDKDRYK